MRAARQLRDVQTAFLDRHPEIIDELGRKRVRESPTAVLLGRAYDAYWRRDLDTAQPIFRMALKGGGWRLRDLRHILPAMLPRPMFKKLVTFADGGTNRSGKV